MRAQMLCYESVPFPMHALDILKEQMFCAFRYGVVMRGLMWLRYKLYYTPPFRLI